MGGRGSGFGGGGSAGGIKGYIIGPYGNRIDLGGMTLKTSGKLPQIGEKIRTPIEEFEKQHYTSKIEYARLVDALGHVIDNYKGEAGSVYMPEYAINRSYAMTHNHPRSGEGQGLLGGTFSQADINLFSEDKITVARASAAEGVYTIIKQPGVFDGQGLMRYTETCGKAGRAEYVKTRETLDNRYLSGEIDRDQYLHDVSVAFNVMEIRMHNDFLKGQKQYGYIYSLERR